MPESTRIKTSIEELLARGLDHYGCAEEAAAIACWREVLTLQPDEERARDYLEAAGVEPPPTPPEPAVDIEKIEQFTTSRSYSSLPAVTVAAENANGCIDSSQRQALEQLMSERRFEDALKLAYTLRREAPSDRSLSTAIQLLKERLLYDYIKRIGYLDDIPLINTERIARVSISPQARLVLRLVDGIATYSDILESCRLGPLKVAQVLARLLERGVLKRGQIDSPTSRVPCSRAHAELEAPRPVFGITTATSDSDFPAEANSDVAPRPMPGGDIAQQARGAELRNSAVEAYLTRDYERAADQFRALLALDPDDELARHSLDRLERLLQAPDPRPKGSNRP